MCAPDSAGKQTLLNTQSHFDTVVTVRYLFEQAKNILLDELQSFQADPYLEMCYVRQTDVLDPRKYEIV